MEETDQKKILLGAIERYCVLMRCEVFLLDQDGKIYLSRDRQRWGKPMFFEPVDQCLDRIVRIHEHLENSLSPYYYCLPVVLFGQPMFHVAIGSFDTARLPRDCALVTAGFTELFQQIERSHSPLPLSERTDLQTTLVEGILSQKLGRAQLQTLEESLDLDPSMMHAAICVELTFAPTSYFVQSCELLYDQVGGRLRGTILQSIREHRLLNHQDISAIYQENQLVIFKSFINTEKTAKAYRVLEVICRQLRDDLYPFGLIEMRMAHGSIVTSRSRLHESYQEARHFLRLGKRYHPQGDYYNSRDLMLDLICSDLHPQIVAKVVQPVLDALRAEMRDSGAELLRCAETMVDSCTSYAAASAKLGLHRNTLHTRLERFCTLTGLDPIHDFRDSLTVKLAAVMLRNGLDQMKAKEEPDG